MKNHFQFRSKIGKALQLFGVAVLILTVLTGCATMKSLREKIFGSRGSEIDPVPQELANEGMEYLKMGQYSLAVDAFQRLRDHYPYSKYAMLAELKIADTLYLKGDYVEGLAAYMEFENLHPKNEATPYVIYQQGMCLYQQMTGYDRDQTPVVQAIQTFTRLQQQFPGTRYAAMAEARITDAQNSLAHHEFYVGEYYYKQGLYKAAVGRFKSLVKNYPDTGFHVRALEYIRLCNSRMSAGSGATEAAKLEEPPVEPNMMPPASIPPVPPNNIEPAPPPYDLENLPAEDNRGFSPGPNTVETTANQAGGAVTPPNQMAGQATPEPNSAGPVPNQVEEKSLAGPNTVPADAAANQGSPGPNTTAPPTPGPNSGPNYLPPPNTAEPASTDENPGPNNWKGPTPL